MAKGFNHDVRFAAGGGADVSGRQLQAAFADISANDRFNGDFAKALPAIRARAIVMPWETDLYFRVRNNQARSRANAEQRIAANPSIRGNAAGGGLNPGDNTFSDAALSALLASPQASDQPIAQANVAFGSFAPFPIR